MIDSIFAISVIVRCFNWSANNDELEIANYSIYWTHVQFSLQGRCSSLLPVYLLQDFIWLTLAHSASEVEAAVPVAPARYLIFAQIEYYQSS